MIIYNPEKDLFTRIENFNKYDHSFILLYRIPLSLCVHIGSKCNFKCIYCLSSSGVNGIWAPRSLLLNVTKLLKKLGGRRRIVISGGEPSHYPHLEEGLHVLKRNGHVIVVATNGSKFMPYAIRYIDWIDISLHGVDNVSYQKTIGVSYHFDRLMDIIRSYDSLGIKVACNLVLTENNISCLNEGLIKAVEAGARKIRITNVLKIGRGQNVRSPDIDNICFSDLKNDLLDRGAEVVWFPKFDSKLHLKMEFGYFYVSQDGYLNAERRGPQITAVDDAIIFMEQRKEEHEKIFLRTQFSR